MEIPPLLDYATVKEYKDHYERHYCRGTIVTVDGIRVYFNPQKFGHAFYENSQQKKGAKDMFSKVRAQRMDWIKLTLEHPDAILYSGWNKDEKRYDEDRRVSILYDDFVVVIEISLNLQGHLKANFVTCYSADKNIDRIRKSPIWDKGKCLKKLEGK
jgi:hypothetical protein